MELMSSIAQTVTPCNAASTSHVTPNWNAELFFLSGTARVQSQTDITRGQREWGRGRDRGRNNSSRPRPQCM